MSALLGVMMSSIVVHPVQAAWFTEDYLDFGEFSAVTDDEQGKVEMHISCSLHYPDHVGITIFTGETYDPETSYADEVPISVIASDQQQPVAYGTFEERNGELVVVSDTFRDDILALVIGAMATSTSTIAVQFFTRDYRFSPDDLDTALVYLFESCT
ncbi:hypothetical protein [Devosia sediminis]|uniref:Uncharacterized protein n=1 Tax=Devosia sediminis TaxID=2798801 RepID=A0A934J0Y8_9HYPH|nr:hypothetical protein [Devosia sediminis]MBJ3785609.1 hypothetical protein [Devosia sediminis]